jgi:hypothetical protein
VIRTRREANAQASLRSLRKLGGVGLMLRDPHRFQALDPG